MVNKLFKLWEILNSRKALLIFLFFLFIYCVIAAWYKYNLKLECKRHYSSGIIENMEYYWTGKVIITYSTYITGEKSEHKINTDDKREVVKKLRIGDKLKIEYCIEDPFVTCNPIVDGEYLNQSWP